MIKFILNNKRVETHIASGTTLLDFIRNDCHLKGTKTGCREGDCGACSILVGELINGEVAYRSMTSCLMPLANAAGKHIVTIEGINKKDTALTPVQAAMHEEGATQCGFCTVGFVVSLTGLCLHQNWAVDYGDAIEAIDGNICRCTGYKSIERAAERLTNLLKTREFNADSLGFAIKNGIVPPYFAEIKNRLIALNTPIKKESNPNHIVVGGGTDLYVQKHEEMPDIPAQYVFDNPILRGITLKDGYFEIGAAATVSDMKAFSPLNGAIPFLQKQLKLVSSTPIRNMATIGGNLINASPIGDMTIWLLALHAQIFLKNIANPDISGTEGVERFLYLKDFYKGYKVLDKKEDEVLTKIKFKNPEYGDTHFNFEKVCKRTYLDIASVNSAIFIETDKDFIKNIGFSMGGVAPTPLFLHKTCAFLIGKNIKQNVWFEEANQILQLEINPISDVRGSADYKRLLATQLFKVHLLELGF